MTNQSLKFIIGLGNPGSQYQTSRHNAGFLFLDFVQQKLGAPPFKFEKKFSAEISKINNLLLVKPQTFMNLSGSSAQSLLDFYKVAPDPQNLQIAFDDLDLPLGQFKIQTATGPKTHNGLNSIYDHLRTKNFTHLRLGIDNRGGQSGAQFPVPPVDYVLQPFSSAELQALQATFPQLFAQLQLK